MITTTTKLAMAAIAAAMLVPAPASAQRILGSDAAACTGGGPAIRANIAGLRDRTGRLKLELYPATEEDFLRDDRDLIRDGRTFRRVWADTPASGDIAMCIRVPGPGRYALLFTHDRDGKNKFNFWRDGAGFVSDQRLGRSRPKVEQAIVNVGSGVTVANIRVQYLRGLGGFSPLDD
ncbi:MULTISPECIES: DUF2141 domain-containing protein [unclassified Sphingosinithalassobacter]|uniref:DUF2141 domain-containing protein n=1 Tax=unclassified Sphingosinithalassobacter TaxID=2676235 RepID=UPI00165E8C1F|nr:DUF2141 domain-containing protein [Sphingosinithalassobacter sp. CS137]